jgi:hypothetical protein
MYRPLHEHILKNSLSSMTPELDERNSLVAWPLSSSVCDDPTFPKNANPVRMKLEIEEKEVFPREMEVHRGYSQDRLLMRTGNYDTNNSTI